MAQLSAKFTFDVNAHLSANLQLFIEHLSEFDGPATAELAKYFDMLRAGNVDQPAVWNALAMLKHLETLKSDGEAVAHVPSAAPPSTPSVPAPTAPAASGWLLEGVSIEGFRGVNNEGNPLELKFFPDKVNSISAQNGVGKSSIYDAIRYAVSGRLSWLEGLPSGERGADYYLNRFNKSGQATIKLRLVEEGSGQKCEVTVTRDEAGNRTTAATGSWVANDILHSLNREFVLLDGPTFQDFITAKPLDRGRTFSGLLGLSEYSRFRQALSGLANTRAFNNHFQTTVHAEKKARETKSVQDALEAFQRDYVVLTGQEWKAMPPETALDNCRSALSQIAIISAHCAEKEFAGIDIDACIETVKVAEGGPKRERLSACIRERQELAQLNLEAPQDYRMATLFDLARAREEAASKTAGQVMLQLFQAGAKALELPQWSTSEHCPLCDTKVPHNLQSHINAKLADFTAFDELQRPCCRMGCGRLGGSERPRSQTGNGARKSPHRKTGQQSSAGDDNQRRSQNTC